MNKDTVKQATIIMSVFIAVIVILMMAKSCKSFSVKNMFKTETVISVTHDTTVSYQTRRDTQYITISGPAVKEYIKVKTHGDTVIKVIDKQGNTEVLYCDNDTSHYVDSIRENNAFKAIISEYITHGKRFNYNIQWANLAPEKVITDKETITKTKNALVKIYVGAHVVVSTQFTRVKTPIDAAPSLSIILSDKYLINARYAIVNQQPSVGFEVKINLKK